MRQMPDGTELEATLMRRGISFEIHRGTSLADEWVQVAHRISQSEPGLARWEVSAGQQDLLKETVMMIENSIKTFDAGPRYVG